ncbi:hypothetical protein STVA_25170 [Allostella vacuolata]|nr:hypothetical protein STVA_25170 [Stella vacuolata]
MPEARSDVTIRTAGRDLVVIDTALADWPLLVAAAPDGAEILLVGPDEDGLARLAEWIADRPGYDALHVLAHGAPGLARLGSARIAWATLQHHRASLAAIGRASRPGGQVLLYGCSIAGSPQGVALVDALAGILEVPVAASVDDTGGDGNWVLEYATSPFVPRSLEAPAYPHVLAEIVGNSYTATTATGEIIIAGGGGGGGGGQGSFTNAGTGGDGGGGASTVTGSTGDDLIFGDGAGGGGGAYHTHSTSLRTPGGAGGGGDDVLRGGDGNDIIFGDGFGGGYSQVSVEDTLSGGYTTAAGSGGFRGGGGGGGKAGQNGSGVSFNGGNGGDAWQAGGGGGGGAFTNDPTWNLTAGNGGGGWFLGTAGNAADGGAGGGGLGTATPGSGGADGFPDPGYGGGGGGGGAGLGSAGHGGTGGTANVDGSATDGADGDGNIHVFTDPTETAFAIAFILSTGVDTILGVFSGNDFAATGAGADVIDGGGGSDELVGMGGIDTFFFDLEDAGAADLDRIWDFSGDKLHLTVGDVGIDETARDQYIADQQADGADRSILFTDEAGKQVTILVKNIARDLTADDFVLQNPLPPPPPPPACQASPPLPPLKLTPLPFCPALPPPPPPPRKPPEPAAARWQSPTLGRGGWLCPAGRGAIPRRRGGRPGE